MSEGFLVGEAVAACLPIAGRVVEAVFQTLKAPGRACRSVRRELSGPLTGSRMRIRVGGLVAAVRQGAADSAAAQGLG